MAQDGDRVVGRSARGGKAGYSATPLYVVNTPPVITEKYTIKKELGKGAYGTVYLAVDNETEEEVAIKRIDDVFRTKVDAKRALREIVILRHCHHPNICGLTYSFACAISQEI